MAELVPMALHYPIMLALLGPQTFGCEKLLLLIIIIIMIIIIIIYNNVLKIIITIAVCRIRLCTTIIIPGDHPEIIWRSSRDS